MRPRQFRLLMMAVLLVGGAWSCARAAEPATPPAAAPAGPESPTAPESMPRTPPIAPGFGADAKAAPAEAPRVSDADGAFLVDAAKMGWAELRAANLAAGKTKDESVKQFAYMLTTDHSKNIDQIEGLAKSRMLDLGQPDPARMKRIEQLQKQTGKAYDAAFLDLMISAHRDAIARYEKGAASSTDAQVKEYAQLTLEDLKKHLAAAQQVRSTIGTSAGAPAK